MRRRLGRSTGFWLQLTLQTAALISAASASEFAQRAPIEEKSLHQFIVDEMAGEEFLYSKTGRIESALDDCDYACQAAMQDFVRPTLLPTPEFDLLGGLDSLEQPDSQDWLFVY